jgi:hypothetical protein
MTCLDADFLLDAVRGQISAAQRIALLHHITACPGCRDVVFAIFRLWAETPEAGTSEQPHWRPEPEPNPDDTKR